MNGNGSFVKVVLGVVGVLGASGIIGLVALGNDQRALQENVKANAQKIADSKEAIQSVPIIRRDLEHIKETIDRSEKRSEEQYKALLDAIKKN